MRSWPLVLLSMLAAALGAGCMPPSTFHTPYVLRSGEELDGVGLTNFYSLAEGEALLPALDFYLRRPLAPGLDYGARITLPRLTPTMDVKYQFLREPVLLAGDLAACVCPPPNFGAVPSLLVGTKGVYGGIKAPFTLRRAGVGVGVGAEFGRNRRFLVEANLLYGAPLSPTTYSGGPLLTLGGALQSRRQR